MSGLRTNKMVVNAAVIGIILPLIAVGVSKYYEESPDEKEKRMNVQFEDKVRSKEAEKKIRVMHDFIRNQATNKEADYSEEEE